MTKSFNGLTRIRKNFGSIQEILEMPNLIEMQKSSYGRFLQMGIPPEKRDKNAGLEAVFRSIFPLKDYSESAILGNKEAICSAILEYVSYDFEDPKYDVDECRKRDMTFGAPLKVTLRLIVFDVDEDTKKKSVKDIKEQEVYMGILPLMTDTGTFVIKGAERVVVSQMHRSPGVFFDSDKGKSHSSGKILFAARVIPYRGSWLDFEFDAKDLVYARIDRKKKFPVTTLMMALGLSAEEILGTFYNTATYKLFKRRKDSWKVNYDPNRYLGSTLSEDIVNASNLEVVAKAGDRFNRRLARKIEEQKVTNLLVTQESMIGKYYAEDIVNYKTGEILAEAGDEVTEETLTSAVKHKYEEILLLEIDHINVGPYIRDTLMFDKVENSEQALSEIHKIMRQSDVPPSGVSEIEFAEHFFKELFFTNERYDLSSVGRVKMNMRLNIKCEDSVRILRKEDILSVIKTLVDLRDGKGDIDDIDNLGNRRVRSVGELVENQFKLGLTRMIRPTVEKMRSTEIETKMPQDLINPKPLVAAVEEFFGSSQLSQYMDQTNPLSEIAHKRRISALGPGGLTRERAGFEVRDVHTTHYGRLCPIETPEGQNIGLISSLATYAKVNKYGLIESPYRKVVEGKITDDVVHLSAMEESKFNVAQADVKATKDGVIEDEFVVCRYSGEVHPVTREKVGLMDVSPIQLVSVAAALIPFLENNDANRALMGSNMQRQAVPLLRSESPFVGTGMEQIVARDSGAAIIAKRSGIVDQVDANRIVVRVTDNFDSSESGIDIYPLKKFQKSNQNTCINQRPIVRVGDKVDQNDIIADGPCTERGELALGKNVLVAFMPWNGYNFEDSILVSERIVTDDVFTSIHIQEFKVSARDTKLGPEEITRDIPNVSESTLSNLDEEGIIYKGAQVKAGDILVGKVTPRPAPPMTPEEKLVRAIFGEKASDVSDSSLRIPPGVTGTVIDVQVLNRYGVEKDQRALTIEQQEIELLSKNRYDELSILNRSTYSRLSELIIGRKAISGPAGFKKNTIIMDDTLQNYQQSEWWKFAFSNEQLMGNLEALRKHYDESVKVLQQRFDDKVKKIQDGDDLKPGIMKMVKVFVAVKLELQRGDKLAGRHGNKGVVSQVNSIEDMPFLEDGTPIDIVLNPLGVPSRMNIGQILETHLGWACKDMGRQIGELYDQYHKSGEIDRLRKKVSEVYSESKNSLDLKKFDDESIVKISSQLKDGVPIATPVFDGAKESDVSELLEQGSLGRSGQAILFDGKTGEAFDRKVTVGYMYIMKLHHLVYEKEHARSIGPYGLVTQQPIGGKAQFGGQRIGEMEVWALEAYGAAYTLQEMLTIKSDDVAGRNKVYEAIVKGDDTFEAGIPESFNVLVKEMRALGLNVELHDSMFLERIGRETIEFSEESAE